MHIVLCLDDRNGISFNGRRLSSDIVLSSRIFDRRSGKLMMRPYSAQLFVDMDIVADDDFLHNAADSDTCFVENLDFLDHLTAIISLTIYRWNRHYPSDVKFSEQLLDGWTLTEKSEFSGNSHDIITEEVYTR